MRLAESALEKLRSGVVILGICAAAVFGCIPSRLPVRRGEAGTVLDARTGAPLSGAVVVVESWRVRTPLGERLERKDVFRTVTDLKGQFQVPEKKEWFAVIPIPDLPPAFNRRLCVTKEGYASSVADPWAKTAESPWMYSVPEPFRLTATGAADAGCPFGAVD